MNKGFRPKTNPTILEAIKRRLGPASQSQDEVGMVRTAARLESRYGEDAIAEALMEMSRENDWLTAIALKNVPADKKPEFIAGAVEIMAEVLIDAGLRIEDHLRQTDQGIALSRLGYEAIAATGFNDLGDLKGNPDTLEGLGIKRDPFMHPLAEITEAPKGLPEGKMLDSWGFASMVINAALGWMPVGPDPGDTPEETASGFLNPTPEGMAIVRKAVFAANPSIDLAKLMARARYSDPDLLRLAGLVREGLMLDPPIPPKR